MQNAHIGISIFDAATNSFWYSYQSDKYFVPASNTKLFSLYAGMKYLGDSLPAARYTISNDTLFILPTGDPTFLHRDFISQPLFDFLRTSKLRVVLANINWREKALGAGWMWDDYNDDYMAERSPLPVYGNVVTWIRRRQQPNEALAPGNTVMSEPAIPWIYNVNSDTTTGNFFVKRNWGENVFRIFNPEGKGQEQQVPFITNGISSAIDLLRDTLKISVGEGVPPPNPRWITLYSRNADSLYSPMMHRSDNFFAEQVLLMASNEKLGYMNDERIIDTILNTDLKDIPQKPAWVDGSGLSRYNLFSPQDFVYILNKMKNDFGLGRLKSILPTGGTGTLASYYLHDSTFIFAKTGSLSNVAALSGFLITRKNRLLVFSILANNFVSSGTAFRKAAEKFLSGIRHLY